MAAGVLRALDAEGLLGEHLVVVGTHSLYVHVAAAGIRFNDDLIATTDFDLLWDARRKLKLALLDTPDSGVMGILRGIDPTFAKSRRDAMQARAVAIMAKQNLGLEFKAKDFTALPLGLVQGAKDLAQVARTAKR